MQDASFVPRKGDTAAQSGYRFEAFWARLFGVKPVRGSGSQWYAKLDVAAASLLFSCKHTDAASFRVTKELMREAERAVNGPGGVGGSTIPALAISVQGDVFVTLRAEDFLYILDQGPADEGFKLKSSKAETKSRRSKIPAILREEE